MEGHTPGQFAVEAEGFVNPVGEELKEFPTTEAEYIGVTEVSPVDAQTAPDHDRQQREVDPVHPTVAPTMPLDRDQAQRLLRGSAPLSFRSMHGCHVELSFGSSSLLNPARP